MSDPAKPQLKRKRSSSRNGNDERHGNKRLRMLEAQVNELKQRVEDLIGRIRTEAAPVPGSPVDELPFEMFVEIFQWLQQSTLLCRVSRVCKKWNSMVTDTLAVVFCTPYSINMRNEHVTSLVKFTRLDTLSLGTVAVSAGWSDVLGKLTGLRSLQIHEAPLPSWTFLKQLTNLESLALGSPTFMANDLLSVPATVRRCSLYMSPDEDSLRLGNLSHLNELQDLEIRSSSPVMGIDQKGGTLLPSSFAPTLRSLYLDGFYFHAVEDGKNYLLSNLNEFTALRTLTLRRLGRSTLKTVFQVLIEKRQCIEHLTRLVISNCPYVTLGMLSEIAHVFPNLTHLDMDNKTSRNGRDHGPWTGLQSLVHLESLALWCGDTFVDSAIKKDASLAFLGQLPALKHLHLKNAFGITRASLSIVAGLFDRTLESFALDACPIMFTDEFDTMFSHSRFDRPIKVTKYT